MAIYECREGLKKGIFPVGELCRFPDVPCPGCLLARKQKTAERTYKPGLDGKIDPNFLRNKPKKRGLAYKRRKTGDRDKKKETADYSKIQDKLGIEK